ncbi:T9SS type B sorting domain-containing protein [Flavobacterium sp.]
MKIYTLFLFLIFSNLACSQKEANIWYFGINAGLDFNTASGSPINLNNGIIATNEGCATVCNSAGQLLFYTDGITVRNRSHQIMPNGSSLDGHFSSTQSAIIVPKPSSSNVYYIFTVAAAGGVKGLKYSEVDMNLNNGFGDVTAQKNIPILTPVCEKICAVKNTAANGFWVVSHSFGDNRFLSIEVTASGVGNIVFSSVGSVISANLPYGIYTTQGYLKISSDGTKLVCVNAYNDVQLFDFDASTGIVSNAKTINTSDQWFCYGAEFSQSGDKLYVTELDMGGILQYDLTAADIPASQIIIYDVYSYIFGALQLAPDGRIYCARTRSGIENPSYLSAINNPELSGTDCQFQFAQVALSGTSVLGLPQSISSILEVGIISENMCGGAETSFSINGNFTILSAMWDFGDGTSSADINPTHSYGSPGTYTVSVAVVTSNGRMVRTKLITILPVPTATAVSPITLCNTVNTTYNLEILNQLIIGNQPLNGISISYFPSVADANSHNASLPYLQNLPLGLSTFYAKVYHVTNFDCYSLTPVEINVIEPAVLRIGLELVGCDAFPYDGISLFDLSAIDEEILENSDSANYSVTYHLTQSDALSDNNAVPPNHNNTSLIETVYVRAENRANPACFSIGTVTLKVIREPVIGTISDLNACDDNLPNDGSIRFDLRIKDLEVLNGQSASLFQVDYYLNHSDATNDINRLSQFFTNSTNPQTLYVRVSNALARHCYKVGPLDLYVNPKPDVLIDSIYSICDFNNGVSITVPGVFTHYLWSNGANTPTTVINQPGSYTVTVGQQYGSLRCESGKSFSVIQSGVATQIAFEIRDFNGSDNVISVNVSGLGDYEYSLNGIEYQGSNVFYGLSGGEYTVYVRDKNGCGISEETVYLFNYPNFFTPNGDGFNDYWKISYPTQEPNLKVSIFDRYGKLVTYLTPDSLGWDGMLNGKPLPSDDYWFVVNRENGKEYKGHFSLKR